MHVRSMSLKQLLFISTVDQLISAPFEDGGVEMRHELSSRTCERPILALSSSKPLLTQWHLPGMSLLVIAVLSLLLVALDACPKNVFKTVALQHQGKRELLK